MRATLDEAVAAHAERAFAFLEALIGAPTTVGTEQAAMALFEREARALGLQTERLAFPNGPVTDPRAGVAPPADRVSEDRYQVLATTPGTGALHLLLNGHMDVVPAETPGLWTSPPFQAVRRNGRLYGRGSADMKSGFAVGLLALAALRDTLPDLFASRRLGFLAVVEEECTGNGTLRSITDHGVIAPGVIVLEPTGLDLLTGGVGVLWAGIRVVAVSGHAEAADRSANAIDLGMKLVKGLRDWASGLTLLHPEPTMDATAQPYNVNLGTLHAGDWISTSPSTAQIGVRIGFPRSWSASFAEGRLRAVIADIAAADGGFPVPPVVTLTGLRAEGYLLDAQSALVRDLAASRMDATGTAPAVMTLGTTTDARIYVNDFKVPALCFGATGHDLHGIDESVDLQSIVDAARTLARFIAGRFTAAAEDAP